MAGTHETLDASLEEAGGSAGPPHPGLVLVFSGEAPALRTLLLESRALTLGRGSGSGASIDDARMSRQHAEITWNGADWNVRDLASRNGTFADGVRVRGDATGPIRVLRVADSVLLPLADARRYRDAVVEVADNVVIGTRLREVWNQIASAASSSQTLQITGETGTGKELAARHFHASGPNPKGPFVAVNCATIPPQLAERILFGAVKGAYSGAEANVEGHLQAARDGTLFLDEIAELPLDVQAKLLRAVEAHEVVPLGTSKAQAVRFQLCSATHVELRSAVGAGRFRDDLYYRIGLPRVALPPLRERREDIPWIVRSVVSRNLPAVTVHASFIEAALLRPWPGNLRELIAEVQDAARRAGSGDKRRLEAAQLGDSAGTAMAETAQPPGPEAAERLRIEGALAEFAGNVAETARALGMHRTQLRRWLSGHDLDPKRFK